MKAAHIKKVTVVLVAAVFLSSCSIFRRNSFVQVKGSDTMVNLAQSWVEKYMEKNPREFIAVTGGGSGTGIASLISGTCDIAMCSREMTDKERYLARQKGVDPLEITVALDGLVVVVNPDNPIDKLTMDQLADIFSGKITNWKELGWHDANIVLLSREINSGTHVYFKDRVLRHGNSKDKTEFAASTLLLSSSQAIADEVAGNDDAIGYYGMGYVSMKQKVVAVAQSSATAYVPPTIESVLNGDYPLSRPLFIYTNGSRTGNVGTFIAFILSEEGQKIVAATDFVPVRK